MRDHVSYSPLLFNIFLKTSVSSALEKRGRTFSMMQNSPMSIEETTMNSQQHRLKIQDYTDVVHVLCFACEALPLPPDQQRRISAMAIMAFRKIAASFARNTS